MTVIAWDGKTLAGDKRAVYGTYKGGVVTKIHRWEGGLCAIAGDMEQGVQLVSWLKEGAEPDEFPDLGEREGDFLVIHNDGRIAYYQRSAEPLFFEDPIHALGSGKDYALAAMHLGKSAKEAVEFACELDAYCGNGVDTLELQCS